MIFEQKWLGRNCSEGNVNGLTCVILETEEGKSRCLVRSIGCSCIDINKVSVVSDSGIDTVSGSGSGYLAGVKHNPSRLVNTVVDLKNIVLNTAAYCKPSGEEHAVGNVEL